MMRWLLLALGCVVSGCYSPNLERCHVTCEDSDHCPGAQLCLDDKFCHQPGDVLLCNPDAEPSTIDAEELPIDGLSPDAEPPQELRTISAGGHHVCAIDADGALWCWGTNLEGQLGADNPALVRSTTPRQVGTDTTWTAVDAGDYTTCGINGGALICWGGNSYGEAVDQNHGSGAVYAPEEADSGPDGDWLAVTVSAHTMCAIHDDGGDLRSIYCAGTDDVGQRGDGPTVNTGPNLAPVSATSDGVVTDWTSISGGADIMCALTATGAAYCWGQNYHGQVGDGSMMTARDVPTRVTATLEDGAVGFAAIAPGNVATCAIAGPGAQAGRLYCWGQNGYGQLGDPAFGAEPTPRRVGTDANWVSISGSYQAMCGTRSTGGGFCWGDGTAGLSGDGTWEYESRPVHVLGLDEAMPISVGYRVACAAPPSGGVACWGENGEGELGNGETSTKHTPALVLPMDGAWTAVATGAVHSCGIHGGETVCWGWNEEREVLGTSTPIQVNVPTAVPGLGAGVPEAISTSRYASCVILDDGVNGQHPWCWGLNSYGEVGVAGTIGNRFVPTQLGATGDWKGLVQTHQASCALFGTERWCWGNGGSYGLGNNGTDAVGVPTRADLLGWSAISLGYSFGCGIRDTSSNLWCWGSDNYGTIGDGGTADTAMVPEMVGTGVYTQVSASWAGDHACAIEMTTSDLWCWGRNDQGQLGIPGAQRNVPTLIDSGTWTAVSAGTLHTCGIKSGQMWCWGDQNDHQLGLEGTTLDRDTPTRIGADIGWTAVSAGKWHTCGLLAGDLHCWGSNLHGQIGDGTSGHNTPVMVMFP